MKRINGGDYRAVQRIKNMKITVTRAGYTVSLIESKSISAD
jgi:hypothetical protein